MANRLKSLTFFCALHMIFVTSVFSSSPGLSPESFDEHIMYSVMRITAGNSSSVGTGTGFIFGIPIDPSDPPNPRRYYPVLISNKHVLVGFDKVEIRLHLRGPDGRPSQQSIDIPINTSIIIEHPTADLCAIPIGHVLSRGSFYYTTIFPENLFDENLTPDIDACCDVTMVEYPLGFYDLVNNYPLFRKGITASHPLVDYNGLSEFLIDAPCMPGSSGSPIFLSYVSKKSHVPLAINRDKKLLGILWGGPVADETGSFEISNGCIHARPLPLAPLMSNGSLTASQTNMIMYPMHLGFVIKAKEIKQLSNTILKQLKDNALQ